MTVTNLEFYAVVPKEATNLILNPSIEVGTTGYSTSNSAISRVTTHQRRGLACLKTIPDTGVGASCIYTTSTLTAGTLYTWSVDILDVAGQSFVIFVNDTGGNVAVSPTWTGNGQWKRVALSFTPDATEAHTLSMYRVAVASVAPFYVDGLQLETGAESSYFDGDSIGFLRDTYEYAWDGSPHASTSWRSGQTRSGGSFVRLKDYMTIQGVYGIGVPPVMNNSLPNVQGGDFFQGSVMNGRTISLKGVIKGSTPGAILTNRKAIIAAINPKLTAIDQPMILQMRGLDAAGLEGMPRVNAICHYSGGLDAALVNPGIEEVPLQFQVLQPYLVGDGEAAVSMATYKATVADRFVIRRSRTGVWDELAAYPGAQVLALERGADGTLYAGGQFTNLTDANGDYISKWNGAAWSSLGTGMNAMVHVIRRGPDGSIYAGGDFTSAGGVANTDGIAKWNGSVWSALGTGISAGTNTVMDIVFGPDGALYASGHFTGMGGVANTAYIAKWDGSAWSALGTGMNGNCNNLAMGLDGTLYAGGAFHLAGGVADTAHIAKWNGSAWLPLGTGADADVNALTVGLDGTLYAGGEFTTMNGQALVSIAKWNGSAWSEVGGGVSITGGVNPFVYFLYTMNDGTILVSGNIDRAGGSTFPAWGGLAAWNGSTWIPTDFITAGTWLQAYVEYPDGVAYVANIYQILSAWPYTVTSAGNGVSWPRFVFTGPGSVYFVKNFTTGKAIFFNLTLLTGETATLNLDPLNYYFTSNFRGSLNNTILPGSALDLTLLPGTNLVGVFVAGTTSAATTAYMAYSPRYESLDGAGVY